MWLKWSSFTPICSLKVSSDSPPLPYISQLEEVEEKARELDLALEREQTGCESQIQRIKSNERVYDE